MSGLIEPDCRVLGTVLHFPYLGERIGVPARVGLRKLDYGAALDANGVPVVALAGTCMEAGKTAAACAMISRMRHRGLVVDGFKATGVSLRRDILAFEDSGARRSMIFTDFGIVTTTPRSGPALTRTMPTEMAAGKPDVIVFELGDGVLGADGVEAILDAPDIRESLDGRGALRQRPGRSLGRRQAPARALRHRARRRHRALHRQLGRRRHHPRAAERAGLQRDDERRRARRPRDFLRGAGTCRPFRRERGRGMSARVPAVILGGTGYVAGELLRLTLAHPRLALAAIASDSQPGEPVARAFPHLAAACGDLRYVSIADASATAARHARSAVLAAAPHGVSHVLIDGLLTAASAAGAKPSVVDISADYRFADLTEYERVYKHPHGAPARAQEFTCAVPEHLDRAPTPHVAHPGCFVTASLLAVVPLLKLGLAEGPVFVSAVTGSTGAGRSAVSGTHHPLRHSDLYSYNALAHRHGAELSALARAAAGRDNNGLIFGQPITASGRCLAGCRTASVISARGSPGADDGNTPGNRRQSGGGVP